MRARAHSIDGAATVSTSSLRVFTSPQLEGGKEFHYTLKAQVMQDGDLVGFIPEIEGSEDFTEEQVIDAIARADYDKPIGHERTEAPPPGEPLAPEGGLFRRFRDGFRYR